MMPKDLSTPRALSVHQIIQENLAFNVPSYQRGYRWEPIHVITLLNDLWDAYRKIPQEPYDLQMLTVRPNGTLADKEETTSTLQTIPARHNKSDAVALLPFLNTSVGKKRLYNVIDGQQRLTTLYLILDEFKQTPLYSLRYERFKEGICRNNDKPDGHFINQAIKAIQTWKDESDHKNELPSFLSYIRDHALFTWYPIPDDEKMEATVFARMNSGKIPLSNAEIIKAIFIASCICANVAQNWGEREMDFRKDQDKFAFICPNSNAQRYQIARMELLLEMEADIYSEGASHALAQHFEACAKDTEKDKILVPAWENIGKRYETICACYEDKRAYHRIGFLTHCRGGLSTQALKKLLHEIAFIETQVTPDSLKNLNDRCLEILWRPFSNDSSIEQKTLEERLDKAFDEWKYGQQNDAIQNLLLMYNIALAEQHPDKEKNNQFPFMAYQRQKPWSLEHIHAKDEKLDDDENYEKCEGVEIVTESDKRRIVCDGDTAGIRLHDVANMALLGKSHNSELHDKSYPKKKEILQGICSRENDYVPLGTRRVFGLVPDWANEKAPISFVWTEKDREAYLEKIKNTLLTFFKANESKED